MNVFQMEDLDHVSKIAPTPLDLSFAAVKVATHHQDTTVLVCNCEYKTIFKDSMLFIKEN